MKSRFAWAVALTLAALLAVVPLFAAEEGTFDRTLKVTGPVDLDVSTGSGSINVHSGGTGQVVIHAVIRASDSWPFNTRSAAERIKAIQDNPPVEQSGNVIRIGHFADSSVRRNVSISYDITTPRETRLRSHSGSGTLTLTALSGPVEANTGSGSIHASDIASDARLGTGSGSIEASGITGSVRASTGSGSITADRVGGGGSVQTSAKYQGKALALASSGSGTSGGSYLEFETGSGHIRLTGIAGELRAHTGSGGIEAEGRQTGDWQLHTGSGSVDVRLPADAKFSLSARSSSGRVSSDFPVTVQGTVSRRELRGDVNGGGPRLDIHTGSGGIRIEK
jgi:hypothetical protein